MDNKQTRGWLAALCLGLGGLMPALAQDEEPAAEEPAAEEAAETMETTETIETTDSSEASDSSEEPGSADAGSGAGLPLYVGVEFAQTKVEVSEDGLEAAFGARRFDSEFYKLRVGTRLFEGIGLEAQVGVPASDSGEGEVETSQYYGLFLVPTGVFMNLVEISARVGYSMMTIENDLADEDLDGMSFALAIELPLRALGESLPDLRLTSSGAVFQQDRDARVYGYTVGLRYDFRL